MENSIIWKVDPHTKLSSYIDSVEYIALETHPDGLFNMVEKLVVQDDKILFSISETASKYLYSIPPENSYSR